MSRKRRRVVKTKVILSKSQKKIQVKKDIYKETLKQVQETNARLKSLGRRYKKGSWASKILYNRINDYMSKGRIRVPKNATMTELKKIQKATKLFLNSKTSTKRGINEVSKSIKQGMKTAFDMEGKVASMSDIEDLYDMMTNEDFTKSDFEDKIGASRMDRYILDAKEQKQDVNEFIDAIESNEFSLDEDLREKAINLYNKYIRK